MYGVDFIGQALDVMRGLTGRPDQTALLQACFTELESSLVIPVAQDIIDTIAGPLAGRSFSVTLLSCGYLAYFTPLDTRELERFNDDHDSRVDHGYLIAVLTHIDLDGVVGPVFIP